MAVLEWKPRVGVDMWVHSKAHAEILLGLQNASVSGKSDRLKTGNYYSSTRGKAAGFYFVNINMILRSCIRRRYTRIYFVFRRVV